jgi:hypothetical protein
MLKEFAKAHPRKALMGWGTAAPRGAVALGVASGERKE